MNLTKIKPYIFILLVFAIPLLFIPIIKMAKEKSNMMYNEKPLENKIADTISDTYAIAIHGGAGNFLPQDLTEEQTLAYKKALFEALEKGKSMLNSGAKATDVVVSVIQLLENNPIFNAGKGAVLTNDGLAELDASIMDGLTRNAGAIAGVRTIKNPIKTALLVMDSSKHVLLSGRGAEEFSAKMGEPQVDNSYFITERSKLRLSAAKKQHGTVGCVVLDKYGNLAGGTSTGGMTNKKYGRIGDSPIIGAGTWADNRTCAISCTGWGEYFIRLGVAHEISALMRYQQMNLSAAADNVIHKQLEDLGGHGGVIGVDAFGNVAASFNTTGMFRATYNSKGVQEVKIFNE
ncbi:MAG: beta-aspartyl-peptidase [Salinivirgaceae bacterium]|nr:MAG: beta-aspartyl-peptidase [Salinivirgaceae bacterium]